MKKLIVDFAIRMLCRDEFRHDKSLDREILERHLMSSNLDYSNEFILAKNHANHDQVGHIRFRSTENPGTVFSPRTFAVRCVSDQKTNGTLLLALCHSIEPGKGVISRGGDNDHILMS
jgi:hypothetical protein